MKGKTTKVTHTSRVTGDPSEAEQAWASKILRGKSLQRARSRRSLSGLKDLTTLWPMVPGAVIILWDGFLKSKAFARLQAVLGFTLNLPANILSSMGSSIKEVRAWIGHVRDEYSRLQLMVARTALEIMIIEPFHWLKRLWYRAKSPVSRWMRPYVRTSRQLGAEIVIGARELSKDWSHILNAFDVRYRAFVAALKRVLSFIYWRFESLEHILGIHIRGNIIWYRDKGRIRRFGVIDLNRLQGLKPDEIEKLLGLLHGMPWKRIDWLGKSRQRLYSLMQWVEGELERTRGDLVRFNPRATLDLALWRQALDEMFDGVGDEHVWRSWLVFSLDQLPQSSYVSDLFDSAAVDQYELEFLLFQLFHPFSDVSLEARDTWEDYKTKVASGTRVMEALLPERLDTSRGLETSSGANFTTYQIHGLGSELVSYTPEGKAEQTERRLRDTEWLRELLIGSISSWDQQICVITAGVGVRWDQRYKFGKRMKAKYKTFAADLGASSEAELEEDQKIHKIALDAIVNAILKHNELPYLQSLGLILKAGSRDSLHDLEVTVKGILRRDTVQVFFEEVSNPKKRRELYRRAVPAIWRNELDPIRGISPVNPWVGSQLGYIWRTPSIFVPDRGGVVGYFTESRTPLVIKDGIWGVIGTTQVGKSTLLKIAAAMVWPPDPAGTEIYCYELTGGGPEADLHGWPTLLVGLYGGVLLFPSQFPSPKAFRAKLESLSHERVFLYYADPQLEDGVQYDLQYLNFIWQRMKRAATPQNGRVGQLELPGLPSLESKPIRRRYLFIDDAENLMDDPADLRARILRSIFGQATGADLTVMYAVKTLEATEKLVAGMWAFLKNITVRGWLVFHAGDISNIPRTIGLIREDPLSAMAADRLVENLRAIRPLGGMSDPRATYGRAVYQSGLYSAPVQTILPELFEDYLKRKAGEHWTD